MARGIAEFRSFVGGEWRRGGSARTVENPSDLDAPVGRAAEASGADVRDAVAAAQGARRDWAATPPAARAAALDAVGRELGARADELGRLLASEGGKPLADAIGEVRRAGDIFRFHAAEVVRSTGDLLPGLRAGIEVEVRRRPVGVVAAITPWNFPLAIPAWKIAPALAYGNTVVFKPSELVPGSACALTEIVARAGVPAGVLNLVIGGGDVGAALVADAGVDAVSFTGSNAVGREVARTAAGRLARVQLEMGGKNPLVVLDDADLDTAVACAVQGAFFATGQRCTASSRLIVTEGIHDRFVAAVRDAVAALRVGHALEPSTQLGPVVDAAQLEKDLAYVTLGLEEGATALVRGGPLARATRGHFLAPTLFVDTAPWMRINREEIFGPVATVVRVRGYEEALAVANDTEFGLVAGIVTTSLAHAAHFKAHAEVGMAMVNLPTAGMDHHAPFGGTKGSSYGAREQGAYAREFYTTAHAAYVRA